MKIRIITERLKLNTGGVYSGWNKVSYFEVHNNGELKLIDFLIVAN